MFKKWFSSSNPNETEKKEVPWIPLTEMSQLEEIEQASYGMPIGVFKHSSRCGISSAVLSRFQRGFPSDFSGSLYFLDLITYRSLSDEIAHRFGVWHESPQLLLIRDGKAVHHASHSEIDAMQLVSIEGN